MQRGTHIPHFQLTLTLSLWCHVLQVQLLVSNEDVENYKQIKCDLDELRLLVEKSELWVYKGKSAGLAPNPSPGPGLKKRKSKLGSQDDKGDKRNSEHEKVESRGSISSTQVFVLCLLFPFLSVRDFCRKYS